MVWELDEVQDFEVDIRIYFSGEGLLSEEDWEITADPPGEVKAGRSAD